LARPQKERGRRRPPPDLTGAGQARKSGDLWIYLALLLITLAIYSQVRDDKFLNFDDPAHITANPHVRDGFTVAGLAWAFASSYAGYWFPLTWLSYMLDCQLFGLQSGPIHLTNVALHAVSTLLLFGFLRRTTGARWRSAFVAFVFALHPLHIESVAWVAERKDVLSALFWMLTFWAYLKYAERRSLGRYVVVLLVFCCGLMSKPMIVTLPLVLLLLDVWPLRRLVVEKAAGKSNAGVLIEKLPLFALSIATSVVTYLVQERGGAVSSFDRIPIATRIGNALVSYFIYISNLFWPANLAVFYPLAQLGPSGRDVNSGYNILWATLAGLGIVFLTVLALRAVRQRPYFAVGWLWYLITLVPVIGLVQAGLQSHADRFTYVPMIGISIALAWGINELFERMRWNKLALAIPVIAVCAAWSAITWVDLGFWRNSITLFQRAIEVTDGNYVAYNNLGAALREDGQAAEALADFEIAARIQPGAPDIQDNLGEALIAAGRIEEAEPHLREALRLRPDFAKAHIDLASALTRRGRIADAESHYRTALQLQPESAEAQYGLGGVLAVQGRREEAIPHFQEGLPYLLDELKRQPDSVDGHYNLGTVYAMMGRVDDAIAQFSEAVRLRPGDAEARVNLGTALFARQRMTEAGDQFVAAVKLRPDYAKAHLGFARVLGSLGRQDEAIREFSEAIRLDPNLVEARQSLAYYSNQRQRPK
jgi:tetratricopeptide (TPR) repeat protein